ncbi:hypothetical protein [Streptomyces aureus]
MRLPFITRLRHDCEIAALTEDRERIRGERNQFLSDHKAMRAAAKTAARQFEDADRAHAAAAAENVRLAGQLRALASDSKPADALAEHEAHRKMLAAALGMDAETAWTRLTAEAERLRRSAGVQAVIDATKARQTRAIDEDHRPIDGGSVGPRALASEVLQQKARGDALAATVEELTAANQACTCGGEQP